MSIEEVNEASANCSGLLCGSGRRSSTCRAGAGSCAAPSRCLPRCAPSSTEKTGWTTCAQRIDAHDQRSALAAGGNRTEVHAEILVGRIGLHTVQRIAQRKRQGEMRERKDFGGIVEAQRARLFRRCARVGNALDDFVAVGIDIGDDRGLEGARRWRQQPIQNGVGAGPQQWAEFGIAVESNSTSSLPFAGRFAYNALMIARVLTVKSTTD